MHQGTAIAVIGDHDRLSFAQLWAHIGQISVDLRQLGIVPGVVVGLRIRDPLRHLVLSLCLLKEGITQVALPSRESITVQEKIAGITGVAVIIGDVMEPILEGWVLVLLDPQWRLNGNGTSVPLAVSPADGPALIFLGSGTTGDPKVIAVDFALLAHLIGRDLAVRDFKSGERHYCESSLDYYTAKRRTLGCLAAGVTVMLPHELPKRLVDYYLCHNIQHVSLTASQAMALLLREREFSTPDFPRLPFLRSMFVGSSPVSEVVRKCLRQLISGQLFVVYGSNEFGEATVASPLDQDQAPGAVGRACPGVLLEVVDDSGNACAAGTNGSIRLRSAPMMHAYHVLSSDSARNFRDGWYYPGDMGWLTEDGNLVFSGRRDDMMIYRGVNIYPREIEAVLESHPAVREVATFPLLTETGENLPFAVVCASGVSEAELLKFCQTHLGWRRPRRIFFANELPRNSAGKVLKRVLAEKVKGLLVGKA